MTSSQRGLDEMQITVLMGLRKAPKTKSCFQKICFRWMGECFLEVLRVHPAEDESLNSLLTLGICKALAITGCADPWQV